MMRMAAVFALLACWYAQAATLPNMPAIGSGLGDLDKTGFQCRSSDRGVECRRLGTEADRIAEEPAVTVVLFYRDALLARCVVGFSESRFGAVVGRLSQQLGQPEHGTESLKAGMGGVFENRYYLWRRNGRVWFIEQFFERITVSGLWVMEEAEFEAMLAERDRMRVRGARDL